MKEILQTLEFKLGYTFKDKSLLLTALTHSSYANENKRRGAECNERLEFLGDSVLGMTVAELIFASKPKMPEGRMTKLRAELVCERSLEELSEVLELGELLRLGKGEEKSGGRTRPSILADALEAVLAAMYLDGGIDPVREFINGYFSDKINGIPGRESDYKTALQEFVQESGEQIIAYKTIKESGPDHLKTFDVEVTLNGEIIGSGAGKSKKEAEQHAAQAALDKLRR